MTYRIPFNRPTMPPDGVDAVTEALLSGRLAGNGPRTRGCESILETVSTARKALLTNSCTAALEMTALLLDAQPGDEVIVPSFTFVSTANAFAVHGLRPVFADCRPDTLNVDEQTVTPLIGPRTRALVAMHYGGVACEMDGILSAAHRQGIVVIEDNAHGLFGTYKGRPLGSLGAMATQSFHETKNVTSGEGGALLLNDAAYVERAEIIREKGTNRSRFFRGEVDKYTWVDYGSNYLASELQAAFLRVKLGVLDQWNDQRRAVADRYSDLLAGSGVGLPFVPDFIEPVWHLYVIRSKQRDALKAHLDQQGVSTVIHYPIPPHRQACYQGFRGHKLPVAELLAGEVLSLPMSSALQVEEIAYVAESVAGFQKPAHRP